MKALFLAVLFFTLSVIAVTSAPEAKVARDSLAPDVSWEEDGVTRHLKDYHGKAVVLHFWATWCSPCVEELPKLAEAVKDFRGKNIIFIPLSLDADLGNAKAFYKKHRLTSLSLASDGNSAAFNTFKMKGLPATVFIGEEGELVKKTDGSVDWKSAQTRSLLEKLATPK